MQKLRTFESLIKKFVLKSVDFAKNFRDFAKNNSSTELNHRQIHSVHFPKLGPISVHIMNDDHNQARLERLDDDQKPFSFTCLFGKSALLM